MGTDVSSAIVTRLLAASVDPGPASTVRTGCPKASRPLDPRRDATPIDDEA